MWNVEREEPQTPLFTNRQEVTQLLKPPPLKPKEEKQNHVLTAQMIICVLLLAGVLCVRYFYPQLYQTFQSGYRQISNQGMAISDEEELVKFANAFVEDVSTQAFQVWQQATDGSVSCLGYGAGGWGTQTAPQGSSLETLEPENAITLPIRGYTVTSEYGWRKDPFTGKRDFHTGIDLAVAEGTAIHSAMEGIVQKSAWSASYGNYVQVLHESGLVTRYCHMQYIFVRQGQRVSREDVLGTVGQTGNVTGPHLHFELFCNDVRYDPAKALEDGI